MRREMQGRSCSTQHVAPLTTLLLRYVRTVRALNHSQKSSAVMILSYLSSSDYCISLESFTPGVTPRRFDFFFFFFFDKFYACLS